jgi:hypothetical protein
MIFQRQLLPGILFCTALCGCARDIVVTNAQKPGAISPWPLPTALRVQYTVMKLDLPRGRQTVEPGEFTRDEVCYIKAGDFRIDCYTDGSALNLGPNDSNDVLTDNAAWHLTPADENDKSGEQALRTYAIVALVAGSVDRLPSALADYLQSPGQHLTQALDLSEHLLSDEQVRLEGFARGGNFTITVQLNDDGREKLLDALDEIGESDSDLQVVRHRHRTPPTSPQSKHGTPARQVR